LTSCASYRQNVMFKVPDNYAIQKQVSNAEKNYTIQRNDRLKLDVFTNAGERIIDPNFENLKESGSATESARPSVDYLVNDKGAVILPMINALQVEGMTLQQVQEILEKEYSKFYQQPFVVLQYTNKRVIVLGAPGGQLIPLVNENVRLTEILAMAKGLDNSAKAQNIRVLRGDKVFVADLSTLKGYLENNMIIEPGDIVYIERFRDYGPMLSILTSLSTIILIITK